MQVSYSPVAIDLKDSSSGVPSGYVKIAIENCHRNSGFTH